MAVIRDPQEKRLRALKMLELRISSNASIKDIAREFNVSHDTVSRNLTWARKAGLIADAEDKALQELLPLAHEALKKALTNHDADVALEIFKGLMPGFGKTKPQPTVTAGDDLASYLDAIRSTPDAIDGEVAGADAPRALPAAAEATPVQGADGALGDDPSGPSVLAQGTSSVGPSGE
jgi:DNA-binding transcriptional ArsR family regulator